MAPIVIYNQEERRCPHRPKIDSPKLLLEAFNLYRWFKLGYLPNEGGYQDQSHAALQIIEIMDAASAYAYDSKQQADEAKTTIDRPLKTV